MVIIGGEDTQLYLIDDNRYQYIGRVSDHIPKRHKKGGQSQNRMQRNRVIAIHAYVVEVADIIEQMYCNSGMPIVEGIVLIGGDKRRQVAELVGANSQLTILGELKTRGSLDDNYQAAIRGIHKKDVVAEGQMMRDLYERITSGDGRIIFGDEVQTADDEYLLEYVYIHRDLDREYKCQQKIVVKYDDAFLREYGGCVGVLYYAP